MNLRFSSIYSAFAVLLISFCGQNILATGTTLADREIADYFKTQTEEISSSCMSDIHSLADWEARRPELQREAREMLGLDPMPPRTELHSVITGRIEEKDFTVEKLCFQSVPHLYVAADLYLPKGLTNPAPTVLYLCGHTEVIKNGVSYGNKTAYQHHGIWFARNGYVCMIVDTLQYGEILGHHHGTYDEGAWWWNSRGYTPAAVETWNAIRALDYLAGRPEVDTNRMGVTGRSGGGAYSWFLAAVDDRVKVVAPVAGIGDLQSYCVDGTVDDHCDCMFFVNTYRWDYPLLAALCAPRPLLLADTDADEYFPLAGVLRTRDMVKRIYDLYGASTNFGLVIAPGPHKDTQDVQVPVFRWFNIHLKHEDPTIDMAAVKMFSPQELKVFSKIPDDQINTRIEYSFEPEAPAPEVPATAAQWEAMKANWIRGLREKCFAGWPADSPEGTTGNSPAFQRRVPGSDEISPEGTAEAQTVSPTNLSLRQISSKRTNGIECDTYVIQSEPDVPLPLCVMRRAGAKPRRLILRFADDSFKNAGSDISSVAADRQPNGQKHSIAVPSPLPSDGRGEGQGEVRAPRISAAFGIFGNSSAEEMSRDIKAHNMAYAIFFPRSTGPLSWSGGSLAETQLRRRYMLVGQTLDGMRVWDICRAINALHSIKSVRGVPLSVEADGNMGVNALYASLFVPGISSLRLTHIPESHMPQTSGSPEYQQSRAREQATNHLVGPDYLNVLKILDIPEAAAMAAERCPLQLQSDETNGWEFLRAMADSPVGKVRVQMNGE